MLARALEAPEAEQSDEEQLKFYLRNERNREMYWDEVVTLVHKSRSLETLYHQEMGKVHARAYSKQLRDIGLSGVQQLVKRMTNKDEDMPVIVQVDEKAPSGIFVQVIDNAKLGGAKTVSVATEK